MAKVQVSFKDLADKIGADTEKVVRGTLLGVSARVIEGTPVGNPSLWKSKPPKGYTGGTLRGAWNAGIDTPNRTKTGSKDKTGSATKGEVSAAIGNLKLGQTFYLSNPQPYAVRVEFGGWSSQRPNGMLRVALSNLQRFLDVNVL